MVARAAGVLFFAALATMLIAWGLSGLPQMKIAVGVITITWILLATRARRRR